MNRHERRAQVRLLEAHDRLAKLCGRHAIDTWADVCNFAGEDGPPNIVQAMQTPEDWIRASEALEADAVLRTLNALRTEGIRLTEMERDRILSVARSEALRLWREKAEETVDYCRAMVAIGEEVRPGQA